MSTHRKRSDFYFYTKTYTITKTYLYNFDPLKPHFFTVNQGFTGVYIILFISAQKPRLWYSLEPPRRGKKVAYITKTCLYNFDPLRPHFYKLKLGFTEVYIIFHISAQNIDCGYSLEPPRLGEAVLTSTHNLCFEQKYEKK